MEPESVPTRTADRAAGRADTGTWTMTRGKSESEIERGSYIDASRVVFSRCPFHSLDRHMHPVYGSCRVCVWHAWEGKVAKSRAMTSEQQPIRSFDHVRWIILCRQWEDRAIRAEQRQN